VLKNDPPAGTKVRFLRGLQKAKVNDIAELLKAVERYYVERPEDLFEVRYLGERMIVQRRDIEEALNEGLKSR
jgi:hypothetical protein